VGDAASVGISRHHPIQRVHPSGRERPVATNEHSSAGTQGDDKPEPAWVKP
jgi:hypothetical protein